MQLDRPGRSASLRTRLSAAAGTLLALSAPAIARGADAGAADGGATTRFDASALAYSESGRTRVIEPILDFTRIFPDGQSLSGKLSLDTITGSTPSGALPSGRIETVTTPSGNIRTLPAGQLPETRFKDTRIGLDMNWETPLLHFLKTGTGLHVSRERDYRSLGANANISVEFMHKLSTVTVGGAYDRDSVDPVGGTRVPLSQSLVISTTEPDAKRVSTATFGLSRIVTRRLLVGIDASRIFEKGYLTEPYKVVSLFDTTGETDGQLTEKRPSTRQRTDIMASSVYNISDDVLYGSYRYYWDDWGVRSSTIDLKLRHEIEDGRYVQPHIRYYTQTAANFFRFGLPNDAALPDFISSDFRLGPLKSLTVGAKYGFKIPDSPGELSVRGEYMRQFGTSHPASAVGVQRNMDLFPQVDVMMVVVGYTVEF